MRHFPIFLDLAGRRVVLSGGGAAALAKLRLILKTAAHVTVIDVLDPLVIDRLLCCLTNGRSDVDVPVPNDR